MQRRLIMMIAIGLFVLMSLHYLSEYLGARQMIQSETDRMNRVRNKNNEPEKDAHYQDLTAVMTPNTVVFPGDPAFKSETLTDLEKGSHFGLSHLHLCNHSGTHIDFPAHVTKGGKVSHDYGLERLMGDGIVIQVPSHMRTINKAFILKQPIRENAIVFFKTGNSAISKQQPFQKDYVYIEAEAAKALQQKKAKMVGIDYISVDSVDDETLPVHKILLDNDILIVEKLELKDVAPGNYQFFVMPLNIPSMDGLPVRVIAKQIHI